MSNVAARLTFAGGTLVLAGLWQADVERLFGPAFWTWDRRISAWRCDAIFYGRVQGMLARARIVVDDQVANWRTVRWPNVRLPELRPAQREAVAAWQAAGAGCIVMPTGTGKTEVALSIMAQSAGATLVVAPVRDLMYQWHRRILDGLGYDAGVIGDNLFRVLPVSVITYDSACIHMDRLGDQFGLIVFDECHHLPGDVRRDAARMAAAPRRLGLTATIERSDGKHADLDWLIGPVAYHMPVSAARGGVLADYEIVRVAVHLSNGEQARYDDLSRIVRGFMAEQRKTDPKFSWEDLCLATGTTPAARRALTAFYAKKAIEDRAEEKLRVLEDLFRLHAGDSTLIFAGSNAMARDVCRRFLIPCLLNHCGKKERREILQGFAEGTFPAIVANQVLDEGVDIPEAKVAIVIGGMASTRQAKQRLGRILRRAGNARAVLYEVVCVGTNEENRSRQRRGSDAYKGIKQRRG